jgi:hypothetical protein
VAAEEQVLDVAARRVVAAVADLNAALDGRDDQVVGEPVRAPQFAAPPDVAVAAPILRAGPLQAA